MWLNRNGKECHYWRKANAIHNFFVENVQDGNDDCGTYDVPKSVIEDLAERCDLVLQLLDRCPKREEDATIKIFNCHDNTVTEQIETRTFYDVGDEIHDLLPTVSGFFFGNTEYDEWYRNEIIETKTICDKLLIEMDWNNEELTYASSW